MGQHLAELRAGLAVRGELEGGANAEVVLLPAGHAGDALPLADGLGQVLARHLHEFGLGIVEVEVRGRAGHEEVDDALGLRGVVEAFQQAGDRRAVAGERSEGGGLQERGEGEGAKAGGVALEEGAAGEVEGV